MNISQSAIVFVHNAIINHQV